MFSLFICLILTTTTENDDLQKALEFQYQQKLSSVLSENEKLKGEIRRLRSSAMMACDSTSENPLELKINGNVKSAPAQDNEQRVYRQGLNEIQNENWDEAILTMEGFVQQFPKSALAGHAIYWIAQVYFQKNEIGLAKAELERLIQLYPRGDRAKRAHARLLSLSSGPSGAEGKLK